MKKFKFLLAIFIILIGGLASTVDVAKADTLDDLQQRQSELDKQIQTQQEQLNAQKRNIKTVQDMINSLESQIKLTQREIDATSSKINLTEQEINVTIEKIDQKQKELDIQKENLYESMRVIYETPQRSTVEIIVGSNNLSEVVDRAQYIESLNYQIENAMNEIIRIKADLENQRNQLENDKTDLENEKQAAVDKKRNFDIQQAEKDKLLSQTQSEKARTQTTLNQIYAERNEVTAEIYALRRSVGGYTSGSSAYPWAGVSDTSCNYSNDPYGFCYRQCTSYAAWYWNEILGKAWYNTRPGSGSAWNWPALASDQGYSVGSSPRVGAIVSWPVGGIFGGYGHVAIVEAVNSDGTFEVSQYNWDPLSYSVMHVDSGLASSARFIY